MTAADIPPNEEERLEALREYGLLDTPCEKIFDTITALAASICGTSMSAISLIDKDRQWCKSVTGLESRETSRDVAFCAHTILSGDMLEVEDATKDHRFHDNPFVTHEPNIRFYAGVPLEVKEGLRIGSLCVIDKNKKRLSKKQKSELNALASIVMTLFDSRKKLIADNTKINSYISQVEKVNNELTVKLNQEKELARISKILNQMYSMLQSCKEVSEALITIKKYFQLMFPNDSGSLYLANKGTNYLDLMLQWKNPKSKTGSIPFDSCWSLRRGQEYYSNIIDGVVCEHFVSGETPSSYMCAPMATHGETLGMLCLEYPKQSDISDEYFMEVQRSFAMRMTEHIALALSNIELRKTLHEQSIRDPLTNLYNRRYLYEYFKNDMVALIKEGYRPGVMIIDIDYFKKINDEYGHHVGDEVLRQFALRLKSVVAFGEVACRIGGEEFVYVCLGKTEADIMNRANLVFDLLINFTPEMAKEKMHTVTSSIGLAIYPQHGSDLSMLMRAADKSLYQAKNTGRAKLIVYSDAGV